VESHSPSQKNTISVLLGDKRLPPAEGILLVPIAPVFLQNFVFLQLMPGPLADLPPRK
jgi:hypothetical protein